MVLRRNLAVAMSLSFRQLRDRTMHGKLHHPLSNDTTMFYQGWRAWDRWRAHLVFSFSDEKLGYDLWTGSKKRQDYVPSFWLVFFSSYDSTVGHIVLDLTSLMYQPTTKPSNRSGYTKKHVIFVMSERKPANPDHAPDMHEEENEDDKPLVRPTTRKDPLEEGRGMTHSVEFCCVSIATRRDPVPFGPADPEVSFERPWFAMDGSDTSSTFTWSSLWIWSTQHVELYVGTFLSCVVLWWSCFGRIALSCHFALDLLCDKAELYNSPFLRLALSRQHCPLWEPLSDLRSHDDPSCLCRESLRINFGTGFSCLWVDKYLWWRKQIFLVVRRPTWDLSEDLLEYIWNSDEQRVSVLICNHQPIGVAQTKRVSVPIGSQLIGTAQMKRARLRHGSHRSHGSEEWVPHQRGHLQGHPWRRK